MAAIIALVLAVAGGDLAVTTAPTHPRIGQKVHVYLTGDVVRTGRLYVYRNVSRRCGTTVASERRIGRRVAMHDLSGSFDYTITYTARHVRRDVFCSYLYSTSCDASGNNCGIPVGLPPDAGYFENVVSVRPASQSVKSAAFRGRVIT